MLVVSFHSYKGGSCRTSTCINTLPYLVNKLGADEEHPILIVDTDIDSQGLTYLVGAEDSFGDYDAKVMLQNRIPDRNLPTRRIEDHRFIQKCRPVGEALGVPNRAVYCLGVNDELIMETKDLVGKIDSALTTLYSLCTQLGFKAIIYDTASGEQFSAEAACKASTVMVCCLRPTKQFCVGTRRYLSRFQKNINVKVGNSVEQTTRVIVLPTAVPQKETVINGIPQQNDACRRIGNMVRDTPFEVARDFITPDMFGIPEVERFKWHEDVLYSLSKEEQLDDDCSLAMSRYEKLAELIIQEGKKIHE